MGGVLQQFPTVAREMAVQALEYGQGFVARQNRMKILLDECLPLDFRPSFPATMPTLLNGRVSKARRMAS